MDIRCRKSVCSYNHGQTCTLKDLNIGKDELCKCYEKDKIKQPTNITATMLENQPKFAPFKNIHKFDINCKAENCIFNENHKCLSNGITILDITSGAECLNFFEK